MTDNLKADNFLDEDFWLEHVLIDNHMLHQVYEDIKNDVSGDKTFCLLGTQECFLDLPDETGNEKYDRKTKRLKDAVFDTLKKYGNKASIRFMYGCY